MPKLRKILCPIDFDYNSTAALEIACELAEARGATVHLLHVARVPSQDMDVPVPFNENPRWERTAMAKLERIARDRLEGKVRYELHVVSGTPDDDVVRMAHDLEVDLVVMATHGRKGLSHLILGSVAERVMREADCPVLTMRTNVKHVKSA
ncbi:MAG TPA: universal stress protein [Candidatus Binataceae bacterium]|nr:universal stress protein [Candidatus Binataceae bacterium]